MATIAVGDIHGNLPCLRDLLDQLLGEADADDVIVFLGDYIDRGPHSRECVDAILRFQQETSAEVVCLLGNHEDWFLRTFADHSRHSWLLGMDALETIRSYSVEAAVVLRAALAKAGSGLYLGRCALPYDAFFDRVPDDHLRFFKSLRVFYQSADGVCSHGGVDTRIADLQQQGREAFIWGAGSFPYGYDGAETVVYGHHNNAALNGDGWPAPKVMGRTIGIDTIAHGVLTAVRLPDRKVFQSARSHVAGG